MAQNIIFDARTITDFVLNPSLGVFHVFVSPMPFQLVEGEEYEIAWDTETYTRTAFSFTDAEGVSYVAVGNTMMATGVDNGDPFGIACDYTNDYTHFFSTEDKTEHYVGVYQKAGRNLVLKDHSGINIEGLDSIVEIRVPTDDGDFQSYTLGARVEKTIDLDFSAGNMEVTPENGTVFGKVVIRQPGTLIPDNIAVDVNVAGIVGTNKGSDMAESRIEYTLDDDGNIIHAKCINLTSLPDYSFYNYPKLQTVDFGTSPNLTKIGYYCCNGCGSLKEVILPASLKEIGMYSFYNSTYIETVRFMGDLSQWMSIERNGEGFGNSSTTKFTSLYVGGNLVSGVVEIPDEFTVIPNYVFYGISNITGVKFPEGCTEIGAYAFSYCDAITEITLPDTVTKVGNRAFRGCKDMTSFAFGSGVTNMGTYVLDYCTNLLSLIIPEGVTMIGDNMCSSCGSLTSVTIPSTVKSIGKNAFSGASNLSSAKFMDTSGWYCSTTSGATSGTNLTVTNASTAASYLKTSYRNYYWYDAT